MRARADRRSSARARGHVREERCQGERGPRERDMERDRAAHAQHVRRGRINFAGDVSLRRRIGRARDPRRDRVFVRSPFGRQAQPGASFRRLQARRDPPRGPSTRAVDERRRDGTVFSQAFQ